MKASAILGEDIRLSERSPVMTAVERKAILGSVRVEVELRLVGLIAIFQLREGVLSWELATSPLGLMIVFQLILGLVVTEAETRLAGVKTA